MLAKAVHHSLEAILASFPAGERWYVYHAHSRKEAAAGNEITKLGYRAFVPIEKPRNKPPRALFSRYGFCRFDMNDAGWGAICEVKGVVDLLRTNGIPRAVQNAEVEALELSCKMGVFDRDKNPDLGKLVEVVGLALANEIGKIRDIPSRKRARVMMRFLGGDRLVSVPLSNLREA